MNENEMNLALALCKLLVSVLPLGFQCPLETHFNCVKHSLTLGKSILFEINISE